MKNEMKLCCPFDFGYGENAPENIQDYLGRLAVIYNKTYTVAKVEESKQAVYLLSGKKVAGAARLFLVTQHTPDGSPIGHWSESSTLAEPGKTIAHWHWNTEYRESPEECERLYREGMANALREQDERRAKEQALHQLREERRRIFNAVKPEWAKAYIVAELHENESDIMSDYYGHKTVREVFLGFSKSSRNSFPELRKIVAQFPEAAHLAGPEGEEHREAYSGGHGYYICETQGSYHSGWMVRKSPIYNDNYAPYADFSFFLERNKIIISSAGEQV